MSSSSRSSSIKSCSMKSYQGKEEDFTKDALVSSVDLECGIQTERITKILDGLICKVKLGLCLPQLVQSRCLSTILSKQDFDELVYIYEEYNNELLTSSLLNVTAVTDLMACNFSMKERISPELGHVMFILKSYPTIIPIVEKIVTQLKTRYTKADTPPHTALEYLLALEYFRDLMVTELKCTAAEYWASKDQARKLEMVNSQIIKEIKEIETNLVTEKVNFNESVIQKRQLVAKLNHELSLLHHDANIKLRKKVLDSERQMVLASRSHVVKYEMLKEEVLDFREAYDHALNLDVIEEKTQRARRFKVETQLLSWLQKYDLEMGEKQLELDEITEMYEEEVRKSKELEDKIIEHDKVYIPLMEERETEYHQEMLGKMAQFQYEHAARVVQNAWKQVHINRAEKKKLTSQLQKKRLMEQKAAAAAERAEAEAQKLAAAAKKAAKKAARLGIAVEEETK